MHRGHSKTSRRRDRGELQRIPGLGHPVHRGGARDRLHHRAAPDPRSSSAAAAMTCWSPTRSRLGGARWVGSPSTCIARGELDGKTVGVAAPRTRRASTEAVRGRPGERPGESQRRERGRHSTRSAASGTATICAEGTPDSVTAPEGSEGVDVFFNVLNTISAPAVHRGDGQAGIRSPVTCSSTPRTSTRRPAEIVNSEGRPVRWGDGRGPLPRRHHPRRPRRTGAYQPRRLRAPERSTRCATTPTVPTAPRGRTTSRSIATTATRGTAWPVSVCVIMRIGAAGHPRRG